MYHLLLGHAILRASSESPRGSPIIIKPIHLVGDLTVIDANLELSSPDLDPPISKNLNFQEAVQKFKKQLIQHALTKSDGNWSLFPRGKICAGGIFEEVTFLRIFIFIFANNFLVDLQLFVLYEMNYANSKPRILKTYGQGDCWRIWQKV
jgi:hypothetical protein